MTSTTATQVAAPPAAVLWDMDGTLVDTEPYWMECERQLVAEYGGVWTDADARSIIGFDLIAAAGVLRERGGVRLAPEEIVEHLLDGVIARIRERVPWRPGARRLLSELNEQGVPCALVTMSWKRLAAAVTDALSPISFQVVVTGDMVEHGKPHPEPYLRAAERLGVDPVQCVAIEDSPTGVTSAGAAGCVVVAVPNMVAIDAAPGRFIVASLKTLTAERLGAMIAATPAPTELQRAPHPAASTAAGGDQRASGRRRRWIGMLALVALVAAIAIAVAVFGGDGDGGTPPPSASDTLTVHAWAPFWALDDSLPALDARGDSLDQVSPLWYRTESADTIAIEAEAPVAETTQFIETARAAGLSVVASVRDGTQAGVMAGILADPEQRSRHIDTIVAFAADNGFDGIDLDYEQFAFADDKESWATTRPNWVEFVGDLADRLHADERTLTVSIPPVYDDGQTNDSGFWVYDYAAITPLVDSIRVMAYDYSNASTEPGAVAPLDWVDRVIAGTSSAAGDPSKLLLGVPLYGYNWPVAVTGTCPTTAEGVTTVNNRSVGDLAQRRGGVPSYDPEIGEWSFSYELVVEDPTTSCTQLRQVNYVDADGAQIRMQKAMDAGFGGVAFFALGYEDDEVWNALETVRAALAPTPTTLPPP